MSEESVVVYNIEVNGQKRKAFDVVALKQFLESKKAYYSILNVDPSGIGETETLMRYIAKAAMDTIVELENAVDEVLGILPRQEAEETEPEPEVEEGTIDLSEDIVTEPEPSAFTDNNEDDVIAGSDEDDPEERIVL
jgi:hypothetical protein